MGAIDRVIKDRDGREPGFADAVEAELAQIQQVDDLPESVFREARVGRSRSGRAR